MSAVHAIQLFRKERDPWTSDLVPVKIGRRFVKNGAPCKFGVDSSTWADYHERLYESNDNVWKDVADRFKWKSSA
jgi:hypothetical protein